jgi:hypothetical protein
MMTIRRLLGRLLRGLVEYTAVPPIREHNTRQYVLRILSLLTVSVWWGPQDQIINLFWRKHNTARLHVKGPRSRPYFSERYGYVKPILRVRGWRVFGPVKPDRVNKRKPYAL